MGKTAKTPPPTAEGREIRDLSTVPPKIEYRDAEGGKRPTITGYAAVFDSPTTIRTMGGEFTETIRPGAFRNALAEGQDVRALFNHDSNMLLGRTKSGTLRLSEDATGLRFEVDPPDTDAARSVVAAIARGDLDGCSFGFMVREGGSAWTFDEGPDGDVKANRELRDLDIYDVGPVTYPAYQDTSVAVRSLEGARRETAERGDTPSVRDRLSMILRLAEAGGGGSLPRVSPK